MRTTTLIPLVALAMHLHGQAGLLDNTFSGDGKTTFNAGGDTKANAVLVQPDGKILVAGSGGDTPGNGRDFVVARYLTNGTLDPDFGVDGIALRGLTGTDEATCIALAGEKILVAGYVTIGSDQMMALARLNADGSADGDFGFFEMNWTWFESEQPYHSVATGIALQPDGRIVLCGHMGDGTYINTALARFEADGPLDETFGPDLNGKVIHDMYGVVYPDQASSIVIQSDGKIVVGGHFTAADQTSCLVRFMGDGSVDQSFGNNGERCSNICTGDNRISGLRSRNGKLVVSATGAQEFIAARYTSSGEFDASFGTSPGWFEGTTPFDFPEYGGEANAIEIQSDGRILLAGTFLNANAPGDMAVARLTAEGLPDATFGPEGWRYYDMEGQIDRANALALQDDGKIIVVGEDLTLPAKASIIRLSNDVGIGLSEANAATHQLSLFPNPASESAQLRFVLPNGGPVTCTLIDHAGRAIRTLLGNVSRPDGVNILPIDLDGLPVGVYLLELRSAEGVGRIPLVHR